MRVAYFINRYPAVSHTFIRREIRALEALGVKVARFALRSDPSIVDDEDNAEASQTRLILGINPLAFFYHCTALALRRPLILITTISRALRMGWRSESGVLRHLMYIVEAAVLANWC